MGCVNSRHRPFRRKSSLEDSSEKRSWRVNSLKMDDWIQTERGLDRSSSKNAKNRVMESEMLKSKSFYDHQIGKKLENPEVVVDMDQGLRTVLVPTATVIDSKDAKRNLHRWNTKGAKKFGSSKCYDHQIKKPEMVDTEIDQPVHRGLTRAASSVAKSGLKIDSKDAERKLDRRNSRDHAKDWLAEFKKFTSSKLNPEIADADQAVVHQELSSSPNDLVNPDRKSGKLKLDRSNSRDANVKLPEAKRLSSSRFSGHLIEKEPENLKIVDAGQPVPQELRTVPSVSVHPGASPILKEEELKQLAAGWPTWLVSVAGQALVNWAPRRASTFEKLEKIGSGTYSNVYRARDLLHNKIVALKKVRFDLNDVESIKFMAREIIVMRRLDHPNVLKLEGLITAALSSSLYLVFEYMDHDLVGLASLPGAKFTEPQVKCYMKQLLSGLEHCHSHGVLHRDIKGSNLLIDSNGVLKIADFGLATFFDPEKCVPLTSHVVTLWYRPPELLLGACNYGVGVDLWSVGCILGELYAGKPILPGKTEVEQLHKIFKLCGSPSESYWRKQKLPELSAFKPTVPYKRRISEVFKDFPVTVLSLLETLLSIDPDQRSSADCALKSEFFKTKPFACDPSSLPRYPPSKEIDAKKRDEAHIQQVKQARQDSQMKKQIPEVKSNRSFTMTMEKPNQDLKSRSNIFESFKEERTSSRSHVPDYLRQHKQRTKDITRHNNMGGSGRVAHSGPLMSQRNTTKSTYVKENAHPPRQQPQSRVKPLMLSSSVSSKALLNNRHEQQQVMNQRRRDRRAYNRADSLDNRHITTPIDPSWYNPSDSKIYMSGPLLDQPSKVDQMLEDYNRQVEECNKQAQDTQKGKTRN